MDTASVMENNACFRFRVTGGTLSSFSVGKSLVLVHANDDLHSSSVILISRKVPLASEERRSSGLLWNFFILLFVGVTWSFMLPNSLSDAIV